MNSMNAAPCYDVPGSPESFPSCDSFFSDNSKSCAPQRTFPSAGFNVVDFHSPPCGIGETGTWESPNTTWNCDMTEMPDLDTSFTHIQLTLVIHIDHLLDVGISGFRILAAGHMNPRDIENIFARSNNVIRDNIFRMIKARSSSPVLINDLWPSWLIMYVFVAFCF